MDRKKIFENYKNIAVIGMSRHLEKPSFTVPSYMKKQGFNLYPVNPNATSIMKTPAYPNLNEINDKIDIVQIFRPSDQALPFIKQAIQRSKYKGDVKLIWLQTGITSPEGKKIAEENGVEYIEDKCMYVEHQAYKNS